MENFETRTQEKWRIEAQRPIWTPGRENNPDYIREITAWWQLWKAFMSENFPYKELEKPVGAIDIEWDAQKEAEMREKAERDAEYAEWSDMYDQTPYEARWCSRWC